MLKIVIWRYTFLMHIKKQNFYKKKQMDTATKCNFIRPIFKNKMKAMKLKA